MFRISYENGTFYLVFLYISFLLNPNKINYPQRSLFEEFVLTLRI